jgi:hypothetical protein
VPVGADISGKAGGIALPLAVNESDSDGYNSIKACHSCGGRVGIALVVMVLLG